MKDSGIDAVEKEQFIRFVEFLQLQENYQFLVSTMNIEESKNLEEDILYEKKLYF